MSNYVEEQNSAAEEQCVVCFKNFEIFSIGECNHPVCFECSTRMRVLCLQNECTICRSDLPKVIFTKDKAPFLTLNKELRSGYYEKKYRIAFATESIQKAFYRLLENRCPKCRRVYHTFHQLKDHVRKEHEMFYCDLCTEHLKIFCAERRCYTRTDLATHRRIGDADNTSHRGHPLCDYCESRFLDKDELFRHLRREHYFCHFCDADGVNHFYMNYDALRAHFQSEHYLCQEDECAQEEFTAVFRTEIDLKAHRASVHAKGLSKIAARQVRTLELDFSFAPRNNRNNGYGENSRGPRNNRDVPPDFDRGEQENPPPVVNRPQMIDARNESEFPSLGNSSGATLSLTSNISVRHVSYGQAGLARTKENFPALGNDSGAGLQLQSQPQPSTSKNKSGKPSASSMLKNPLPSSASSASSSSSKKSVSRQNQAPNMSQDFPALSTNNNGKKKNQILMEDMVVPNTVNQKTLNQVPAKHRALVDDYVSIATKATKVNIVRKEEQIAEARKAVVPKLNSANNFPALGETPAPQGDNVWAVLPVRKEKVKANKNQDNLLTMYSKKVAPAPDLQAQKKTPKYENEGKNQKKEKKNKKNQENEDGDEKKQQNDVKTNKKFNSQDINIRETQNIFPALQNNSVSAPPGFSPLSPSNTIKNPPPGLNVTVSSRKNNNLTFTNSSGENFSIQNNSSYSYLAMPDSVSRNRALVSEFQKILKSPEALNEFMCISQMFRDGNYFPSAYYDQCKHVLGDKFETIFPELLVLLPDISKQQSLYLVHTQNLREQGGNSKKKQGKLKLDVCATCKQVCLVDDLVSHGRSHILENSFPTLSDNSSTATSTAWKK